jgi:uncharacterized membrane-anchored protein YhcB (DUF1043 family)
MGNVTDIIAAIVAIIAAIGGLAVGNIWGRVKGERTGWQAANAERMRENAKRMEQGREAVMDGRASGDSPDDRVRKNDGAW